VEACACSAFAGVLACVFFGDGVCAAAGAGAATLVGEATAAFGVAAALAAATAFGGGTALVGAGAAAFDAGAFDAGAFEEVVAALGRAFAGAPVPGFCAGAPALALICPGVGATDALGGLFFSPTILGWAGLDWDLGMEVGLGGTCFADAAAGLPALGGVTSLATFAALGVTGLAEDLGADTVLEAEGIDREPLVRGLEMLTWLSEPIFSGAVLWICVEEGCGFMEGIP
jgi:hypothetical protein